MTYKAKERKKGIGRIIDTDLFGKDKEQGISDKVKKNPHLLNDTGNNFFPGIRTDIRSYFERNEISWQGVDNILSSQVASVNHLFHIRHNKHYFHIL